MKKLNALMLVVLVAGISIALQTPGRADESMPQGCMPRYWARWRHYDSWVGYSPRDSFRDVFGAGPDITLRRALWRRGGGKRAFTRHAVAALLNAAHPDIFYAGQYDNEDQIKWFVAETYSYPDPPFREKKDTLKEFNQAGCPLN